MSEVQITMTFDDDRLGKYTDEQLATLWHLAQANPAPHGDPRAGEIVERIGREIICRWLRGTSPALWRHQGRDYYRAQLSRFAKYEPGGPPTSPEWRNGTWHLRDDVEATQSPRGER